jgi:hypothetical protein
MRASEIAQAQGPFICRLCGVQTGAYGRNRWVPPSGRPEHCHLRNSNFEIATIKNMIPVKLKVLVMSQIKKNKTKKKRLPTTWLGV